jgi:putative ABC transport system permease protein
MTLKDIAIGNLKRRKGKAAFILLGLLIGVSTVVAFISLVDALTHDINHKLEKYGANILILPKTENLSLSYGGISLGGVSFEMQEIMERDLQKIGTIKNAANIAALGPMVLGAVQFGDNSVLLAGVDFHVSPYLRPWWNIQGREPAGEEVLAGAEAARILGIGMGDDLDFGGRSLRVSGMLDYTGSQDDHILFVRFQTGQALLGKEGQVSMAEVAALCAGCPVEEMVEQISGVLPEAKVMAIKQVVESRMEALGHFQKVAYLLSGLVMFVGSLMVLVTMMGSVRERTSEFGIFRAIGFKRIHVVRLVLMEAGFISAAAGILGYLIGHWSTKMAIPLFTESHGVHVPFNFPLAGGVILLAVFLGLLSSLYPALLAARLDPNEALRRL